ncbi:MAG: HEAT repeat domain-containing protein [Brasilonema angustatum HA4187-MV1]|jgi:HEAT repeat protein|nr:HEAT repeat domain-containing protein [Brasilonema angustatum HA4187-MV1]
MSADFQKYLQSVCDAYQCWWSLYTITDVEGSKPVERKSVASPFDFGLMVQTVQPQQQEKGETPEKTERLPVQEGLRKYSVNNVLLVGRPGSGKSTALARLLLEEAGNSVIASEAKRNDAISATTEIPVLVQLRNYGTNENKSVLDIIQNFLLCHDPNLTFDSETLKTWLRQGQFLLLVDGVNELPNEDARRDLKTFRQNYPNTPMIFTTRDLGVGGDLGIKKKLEMQPLTEEQMQEFVRAYLSEQGEEMLRRLGGRLREFGQTPLLLWMLCELFRTTGNVPPNLGLVFRYFAQSYDGKIKDDVPVSGESRRWWQELLQHLAFAMMQVETRTELRVTIERREAEAILEKFLRQRSVGDPASRAKEWLEDLLKHHLIQVANNEQIEFRHQLLQEYYAAECLLQQLPNINDDKLKRDYLNYWKWTEPLALMLGLVEKEAQALWVVKLALEVDLALGARLAGEVKRECQEKTVGLILGLHIHKLVKIEFLGITRSKYGVAFLINSLQYEDSSVRESAASALGRIGSESTINALLSALQDKYLSVCWNAASALGRIGSESAINALLTALQDQNSEIRRIAASTLGSIGNESAVNALMIDLQHEDSFVRVSAASTLGSIGNKSAVNALLSALQHEDSSVRLSAIFALEKIANESAVAALITAFLQHEDLLVRSNAGFALGKIGNESAVAALITALQHEDLFVRWNAASVLGRISNQSGINALFSALQHKDSSVREIVASALERIGNQSGINALLPALYHEDLFVRGIVASVLEIIDNKSAVNSLIADLQHKDSSVRSKAAYVLGKIGNESAVNALLTALQDEDSDVRLNAASALGRIGNESAVNALLTALQDEDSNVRWNAASALGNIAGSEIMLSIWKLRIAGAEYTRDIILKIQERCKFYNNEIFHSPPGKEDKPASFSDSVDKFSQSIKTMSETPKIDFSNATFGNITGSVTGNIQGDNIGTQQNYAPEQKQNLVEAAKEIQELLNHLSVSYPTTTTESQKQAIANQAIARIKRDNPTTWQRLRSATEAALIEALKEVLDNPFVNVTVAAVEGYRKAE